MKAKARRPHILLSMHILRICFLFPLFAQGNNSNSVEAPNYEANQRIMLARSSTDYQVTPGDVYTLIYSVNSNPISYAISVDASSRVRVSNLGIVNAAGKTFTQLKAEVENIVANSHPFSGVQLVLTQPAIFKVMVNGEVHSAGEVTAWGLSRLSSLANQNLTFYSSIRDITITSSNGQTRAYDLYKARRLGDMSQDPYLRPGDIVAFNRIKRVVTVNGAIERPGSYQLLDGENLKELIEIYGSGFRPDADKTRSTLTRYVDSMELPGEDIKMRLLSEQEIADDYQLQHMDIINIPLRTTIFMP